MEPPRTGSTETSVRPRSTPRRTWLRWSVVLAWATLAAMAAVAVVVVSSLGTDSVPNADPAGDATFLEWSMQNGRLGREGILEVRLNADEDRPELVGVGLSLYPTLQSNGAYTYQVRIDGTGDICGFLEGTFEIDGNVGRFLNNVFPDPDEMNVGASRPYFPHICKPDPQPGTIDAVLVAPFDLVLEPGVLTMSNSGGTVRFVASTD